MIQNWKDTLANHSPAYQPNDWNVLSSRLSQVRTGGLAFKVWLLTAAGILVFMAGFFTRGWMIEDGSEKHHNLAALPTETNGHLENGASLIVPSIHDESTTQPKPDGLKASSNNYSKEPSIHSHKSVSEKPTHHGHSTTHGSKHFSNHNGLKTNEFGGITKALFQSTKMLTSHIAVPPTLNSTFLRGDSSNSESLNPTFPEPEMAEGKLESTEVIEPKANSSISVTLMPFAQFAWVDRNNFSWVEADFEKRFSRKIEVGLNAQFGKYLTAGIGYGFQTWKEPEKPNGISQYTAHDPLVQMGAQVPILKRLHVTAHVGTTLRFHKYTFIKEEYNNAEPYLTKKRSQEFLPDVFAGIGLSYEMTSKNILYSSVETGGRAFTIGFKRALFN